MYQNIAYPAHITDSVRLSIAAELYQKELRKLLPGHNTTAWKRIDQAVLGWRENPKSYRLEHDGVREFWDIFAALLESVKLKPEFVAWLTAENVGWRRQAIAINQLQITGASHKLQGVPGMAQRNELRLSELSEVMSAQPKDFWSKRQQIVEQHSQDQEQNAYPIIVRLMPDGCFQTLDGNRRSLLAFFRQQPTIDAWVATLDGERPTNYWIPVNDMLQLAKTYQRAIEQDDSKLQQALVTVLKSHFEVSTAARLVYQQRVLPYSDWTRQLFQQTEI